jgi:ADP-dependent NAD(P)H-hydrate dehydratase / NAD(P)H-hydrate epimerase
MGNAPPVPQAVWLLRDSVAPLLPPRPPTAHKGDAGRIFLLAGSEGMAGAAALAATGAVRGGGGLVTLGCARGLLDLLATKLNEVMTAPMPETDGRALDAEALGPISERAARSDALAIGPGLGQHPRTGELVRALARELKVPTVFDADALNLLSPAREGTFPANAVLTPHPGELARLLDSSVREIEQDRIRAAREAAARFGCVVLLKGAATLVAAPDGRLGVNSTGTPAMATGGCGDVLTGLIAAHLGQRLPHFAAACAGAYLHGLAGELAEARVGGPGLTAGDLVEEVPRARATLHPAAASFAPGPR